MLEIELRNLSLGFGDRTLFSDARLSIYTGDKIGLIGANGCGKTTLLRALLEKEPQNGIYRAPGLSIGYLEQQQGNSFTGTVWQAASEACSDIFRLEEELERISAAMAEAQGGELERISEKYSRMHEEFERRGGYGVNSRILGVLRGIGLTDEYFDRDTSVLSGGEKARLAFARLLLSGHDILLLDEPTNHLDLRAAQWLTDFLCSLKTTVLVVSHDRYLLDRLCGTIAEIYAGRMYSYKGNYTAFREKTQQQRRLQEKQYQEQQQEIKRQQEIIKQFRSFNREKSIRAAESREKALARMELVEAPETVKPMTLRFAPFVHTGSEVLALRNMTAQYPGKQLISPFSLTLLSASRVCIVGDNGCGKTTLLESLLGRREHSGEVKWGAGVKIGYYDQHHRELDPENTVLDEIWRGDRRLTQTQVRSAAAAMLFSGEDVFKKVKTLSGGEKARTALCRLALSGCNVLLLDEPTNHLDIDSREVLEEALGAYEGTIICVSHDRYFINRLASEIWQIKDGALTRYPGNYDDYVAAVSPKAQQQEQAPVNKTAEAKKRAALRETRQAQKQLKQQKAALEGDIVALEKEKGELENLFASSEIYADTDRLMKSQERYRSVNERLEQLYDEYLTLE